MNDIDSVESVSLDFEKIPLLDSPIFLGSVVFYTLIMGVGFLEPVFGLIGLCIIALISIFRILFKNFPLIVGMIILAVVCTAIPFLLIIYIPILIFFFLARLGYFLEHWRVVLAGLVVYFLPAFILAQGMKSQSLLIFLIIPTILFPTAIYYFYKNYNYTVGKILELFSEAPILIISILLPFLKLGISIGEAPVAANSHVTPEGYSAPTEALTAKPSSPVITTPVNSEPVSLERVAIDPVNTSAIVSNHTNSNFNLDSFYHTLSHSHQLFGQTGNENIMSFGNKVQIGMGSDHIALVKDGFHVNVLNSEGHQIGTIENNLSGHGALEIKDTHGMKMGEIEFSQEKNAIVFKDAHNVVMASVDQSIQSDLSKSILQAELDRTQAALDQLDKGQTPIDQLGKEQAPVDQVEHANSISLAMLSILAVAKDRINKDINHLEIKDVSATKTISDLDYKDLKPLHPVTFATYIEKYCSKNIRKHEKIFLPERFSKIANGDWRGILGKYKVSKEEIGFVASTLYLHKDCDSLIITKNDVIHARISGHEPVSYHLSQIEGIKKGSSIEKNHLDDQKIFLIQFDESWMSSVFRELHELFVQYRKLN
ncbi:hypothetical protein [Acinetobacter haemolyticus]|uniref:hypothetical protein n=1 Tax=Acinetobacter haemolyticus TaxID=29430 RepID=UPI001372E03F|nr:hypothetical protein [Acinetobacter haemolyticus]NAR99894.1 hypothetical protein [Acinetobacter haemolyticus]